MHLGVAFLVSELSKFGNWNYDTRSERAFQCAFSLILIASLFHFALALHILEASDPFLNMPFPPVF